MSEADRRVCVVGDSFVAGVGDPEHRGWVGRLVVHPHWDGNPLTAYNLGVRRDTSEDVWRRLPAETAARYASGCDNRLVASFGVNDTTQIDGVDRVDAARSVANLRRVAGHAAAVAVPLLVVGPPPVAEAGQNERIAALDSAFRAVAANCGFPYVGVLAALLADPVWMREVRFGDGAHPGADGYGRLAELVQPAWRSWLGQAP
ncbi:GDSL-type esterase/lipase family protein [Pseudonocardia sp. MH-G8]|uniref:GDSL-type esterase/lipase family protein n=1 Tax=Pseudonocardia sp. MH-G8 TaxID=1854588 RepID=UPI000BA16354|nr:GDSL-type esterase/lipase family protein [Pseudonocardia sp. MH-G8]OZM78080.1 G-D-S-L family lipolytic protein [Pseudonocardia sp. MH-G8]